MRTARRLVPVIALTATIAAGAAACGSSGSTADSLAGLTSAQIAQRAVDATEAAPSVRMAGTGSNSGQPITLNLTLVRGKGCEGTLSEAQAGSFRMVYDGSTVWVLPDSKFYQYSGVPAAAQALVNGKYLG